MYVFIVPFLVHPKKTATVRNLTKKKNYGMVTYRYYNNSVSLYNTHWVQVHVYHTLYLNMLLFGIV